MRRLRSRGAVAGRGLELLQRGALEVERLDLVLGEVGHVDVGADGARAAHRCQLAEQQAQQRRLAGAVRADERQLLAPLDHEVDVASAPASPS